MKYIFKKTKKTDSPVAFSFKAFLISFSLNNDGGRFVFLLFNRVFIIQSKNKVTSIKNKVASIKIQYILLIPKKSLQ